MSWWTISPADRLRFNPSSPEAQNRQPMAQPTWVEMQMVLREFSCPTPSCGARMITVSISEWSPSSSRSLSVTSSDCFERTNRVGSSSNLVSSQVRSANERLVISAHVRTLFL